jgi:hypothetical protein
VAYRFGVTFVARLGSLLTLISHVWIVACHVLRVTALDILTRVVVSLLDICTSVKLLKELLLLLKLNLMLLNNRGLRIVFDPLYQSESLLLFHFIDELQLLLRVVPANLLKSVSQRVEVCGASMISRRISCLNSGLGSFLVSLDRVSIMTRRVGMMTWRISGSVGACCQRSTFEARSLSKSHYGSTSI